MKFNDLNRTEVLIDKIYYAVNYTNSIGLWVIETNEKGENGLVYKSLVYENSKTMDKDIKVLDNELDRVL